MPTKGVTSVLLAADLGRQARRACAAEWRLRDGDEQARKKTCRDPVIARRHRTSDRRVEHTFSELTWTSCERAAGQKPRGPFASFSGVLGLLHQGWRVLPR